jgi:hypothetical protein
MPKKRTEAEEKTCTSQDYSLKHDWIQKRKRRHATDHGDSRGTDYHSHFTLSQSPQSMLRSGYMRTTHTIDLLN